jgi:hypothetical protein
MGKGENALTWRRWRGWNLDLTSGRIENKDRKYASRDDRFLDDERKTYASEVCSQRRTSRFAAGAP